jgi:SWI/SNF-related matrix-associated actin-dependent regulator of chromatin subfamily A3
MGCSTGLGKTMQTIALICTDDTGEGVLDEPEEPDDRFDDMTLIGKPPARRVTSNLS